MIRWLVPFGVLISIGASAQPMSDAAYCLALSEKYETLVAPRWMGQSPINDTVDGRMAVAECKAGNTAAAIPVLEQKLRNARIDLPPRGQARP